MKIRLSRAFFAFLVVAWAATTQARELSLISLVTQGVAPPVSGEVAAPVLDTGVVKAPPANPIDFDLLSCESFCEDRCKQSGVFGEVELLLLQYHRADGIRIGTGAGESGEWDYKTSPRITLGYVSGSGLGLRGRYWEFDQFQPIGTVAGEGLGVDTFNVDFEVFETFDLSCNWKVELSGGLRYNEFTENMINSGGVEDRRISVDGWGLMAGVEAQRKLRLGSLYGRARGVVMLTDKHLYNELSGGGATQNLALNDVTAGMLELSIGYELDHRLANGSVVFGRIGAECQYWSDYSNSFTVSNPISVDDESFWAGPAGVGFGGLVLSMGMRY